MTTLHQPSNASKTWSPNMKDLPIYHDMTLDEALREWQNKHYLNYNMSAEDATNWLCQHVRGFVPKLVYRYDSRGDRHHWYVASNGYMDIALSPFGPII